MFKCKGIYRLHIKLDCNNISICHFKYNTCIIIILGIQFCFYNITLCFLSMYTHPVVTLDSSIMEHVIIERTLLGGYCCWLVVVSFLPREYPVIGIAGDQPPAYPPLNNLRLHLTVQHTLGHFTESILCSLFRVSEVQL